VLDPLVATGPRSTVPSGQMLSVHTSHPQEQGGNVLEQSRLKVPSDAGHHTPTPTQLVAVQVISHAETRADAVLTQNPPVLVPTEEGDFWHATVQQLMHGQAIAAMVRELALQSQLVARDTDQWLLRVERESLNQSGARERLAQALQGLGFVVKLAVEIGRVTDSPGRRIASATAERQLAAEKAIFEDPFVQSMMRDFGAKIVPGTIKPL
jgi:DNA polymerase III subunit gamma/tau